MQAADELLDLLAAFEIFHGGRVAGSFGPILDDGLAHGEALEGAPVDLALAELIDQGAVDIERDLLEKLLGEVHQVVVVGVGLVELEHGELGVVAGGDALVAEVAVDLVDAIEAADDQALEVELGGDAQEKIDIERVVVGDEGARGGASGDGLHHRSLDLDEVAGVEEAADGLHDAGALDEDLTHVGIDEIDVAHAVAQLDVGEAVELLGHRQKIFGEEGQLFDVDAELAGAGAEEIALDADVVADVEELVELPQLVADGIFLDVDLELLAGLLKMGEAGFAHEADGDQASGNGDGDALGLELLAGAGGVRGENLGHLVGGIEVVRVGRLTKGFDLLQLLLA